MSIECFKVEKSLEAEVASLFAIIHLENDLGHNPNKNSHLLFYS
jgi:hypothetical protein